MNRIIKKLKLRDESGAALVLVALGMVALLGFSAIVIDVGRVYLEKSKLQKALDAGVLAGAHRLFVEEAPGELDKAFTIANEVSKDNGYELEESEVDLEEKDFIRGEKTIQVPMTFAKVFDINSIPVTASAKAEVGTLKSANGIAPIAVESSVITEAENNAIVTEFRTDLVCTKERKTNEDGSIKESVVDEDEESGSDKHSPGNCGYLSIDGTGAYELGVALRDGASFSANQDYATTEPGTKWGQVKSAIEDLTTEDEEMGRDYCNNFGTADNSCSRVINIIIIDEWDANGRDEVTVKGFASFWLEDFKSKNKGTDNSNQGKSIKGRLIKAVAPGEIDKLVGEVTSAGDDYLFGVKLTE